MTIGQRIGKNIIAARTRRGLNQPQLAALVGVTRGGVGNWERGQPPRVDHLVKVARVTKTPIARLLAGVK